MSPKYLSPTVFSLAITVCVIFISCGDEGELVKDELSVLQQPSPEEPIPEPPSQQPQPGEQIPEPADQQQP